MSSIGDEASDTRQATGVRMPKRHCWKSTRQKSTRSSPSSKKADVAPVRYSKAVDHHMPLQMDRTYFDRGHEGAKRRRDDLLLHLNTLEAQEAAKQPDMQTGIFQQIRVTY